jgi:predicted Zn finger-like uncharacterized protein
MPEQVHCPSCSAPLRVPDTLLGKSVKCPKCQTTFLAEPEELAHPQGVVREPTPSASRARLPEEDESEEFPAEEEEYPRRGRRRRRGSTRALESVSGPAIALMIAAALGLFCNIGFVIYRVIVLVTLDRQLLQAGQFPGVPQGSAQANTVFTISVTAAITSAALGALMCLIALIGAVRMKQLKNYGLAVTASVLSLVPLNCCCFLGFGFGIWGLVVLLKPEIKDAFS